jgi:hypothetical protein
MGLDVQLATMKRFVEKQEKRLEKWDAKTKKEGHEMIVRTQALNRDLARAKERIDELIEKYRPKECVPKNRLDILEGRQTDLQAKITEIETPATSFVGQT